MRPVGIKFPTPGEAPLRNAAEYRGLSARERLDCLLALIRTVESISQGRPDRAAQLAQIDRIKGEELDILVRTQVQGHV